MHEKGATAINPVVRWLPSLADLAFVIPMVWLFGRMEGASALLRDGDTGWHLRTGEWILAHGRVPHKDLFSFTKPADTWYAWEWLWDVLFGWLNLHGGLAAVVLASAALLGLISFLVYRLALRMSGNAVLAAGAALLAAAGSSVHWLARPHLATLLMVVVFYGILEGPAEWRRLALLPVLMVLWTNLHGGFFVGVVLILAYAAGEALSALLSDAGLGRGSFVRAGRYLATAALAAAASLVNPYGYDLHRHIFRYLSDGFLFENNMEFLPLDLHQPAALYFELMLLAAGAAAFWSLRRGRFAHALLVAGWAHLGLQAGRNVPIFMIIAAPVVALAMREWLDRLRRVGTSLAARGAEQFARITEEINVMEKFGRVHAVSMAALAVAGLLLYAPAPPQAFRAGFSGRQFPVRAVAALGGAAHSMRIFTNDQWGDYLIYSLFPEGKVFVDGRSDFYGTGFTKDWLRVMKAWHGWEERLRGFGVDAVLLPPDLPLVGALKQSPAWRVAYDDGTAIVFRPVPESQQASVARSGGGPGRDREITKSQPCGREITANQKLNPS